MTVLLPWFALVVTVLAGWAIIKRLSTSMVLGSVSNFVSALNS